MPLPTRTLARLRNVDLLAGAGRLRAGSLAARGTLALALSLAAAGCGARNDLPGGGPPDTAQGQGDPCPPAAATPFSQRFGGVEAQVIAAVVADRAGYPVVAGAFAGTMDLGPVKITAPPPQDDGSILFGPSPPLTPSLFVARLAPAGCGSFAVASSALAVPATGVTVGMDGDDVILGANYQEVVDFGSGPIGMTARETGAVLRFAADGTPRGAHAFVGDTLGLGRPAPAGDGSVFVGGTFTGKLLYDGVEIGTGDLAGLDAFVARIGADGGLVWSRIFKLAGTSGFTSATVAAWPGGGGVALAGQFVLGSAHPEKVDLGGGPELPPSSQTGFVTVLDADGKHRWDAFVSPLVVDAGVDPSSGTLVLLGGWDGNGVPVQRYAASGQPKDATVFPVPAMRPTLAVGADGSLLVAGVFNTLPTLESGFAVLRVDPGGALRYLRTFGDLGMKPGIYAAAPGLRPDGVALLGGAFTGTIDVGAGSMTATPAPKDALVPDAFIAALPP